MCRQWSPSIALVRRSSFDYAGLLALILAVNCRPGALLPFLNRARMVFQKLKIKNEKLD
jgi:hypothetical protein